MSKGTTKENQGPRLRKPRKRTWQAPSVKSGALFETNSLACAKVETDEGCQSMGAIKSS